MNVLLIGCGNIGALYDFDSDHIQTYAKALSGERCWNVSVHDTNAALAQKVANKYGFTVVEQIGHLHYDLVCIATPTAFHFPYLKQALLEKVPLILCEKPVSPTLDELDELEALYGNSSSRVIVNYIRRFQPAYTAAAHVLAELRDARQLESIRLSYRRGLLNNATHGLDLAEFMTGQRLDLSQAKIHAKNADAFADDPTVTCTIPQDGFGLELVGIGTNDGPVLELELNFSGGFRVLFPDNGNTIHVLDGGKPVRTYEHALKDYMETIIALPERMRENPEMNDNFMESTDLNRRVLELMKTL